MLFSEFIKDWSNYRLKCSDGWKICQDQIIRDHILPHLANIDMETIKAHHISLVLSKSRDRGHAGNTQKKIYMVLSKIFNDAVREFEILVRSPVKKSLHCPTIKAIERPFMDAPTSLRVLHHVRDDKFFGAAVWIQTLAGLRVSEVQGLRWSDIDFNENLIHVRRKFNRITDQMDPFTKNGMHHRVPLAPLLKQYLENITPKVGFVCKNTHGQMMNYYSYRSFINKIAVDLNLPISASHGLRHSSARLFVELGASNEDLQQLLNHSSPVSTKTYTHRDISRLIEITNKIAFPMPSDDEEEII